MKLLQMKKLESLFRLKNNAALQSLKLTFAKHEEFAQSIKANHQQEKHLRERQSEFDMGAFSHWLISHKEKTKRLEKELATTELEMRAAQSIAKQAFGRMLAIEKIVAEKSKAVQIANIKHIGP